MNMFNSRLYYSDPYIKSFTAAVTNCSPHKDGFEIELDETAFYPEGGGQPADTGTINQVPVIDVREREGRIIHIVGSGLGPGASVVCEIDLPRRFAYMQHHTAEHIISGLAKNFFGLDNVGFHMKKCTAQPHDTDTPTPAIQIESDFTTIDLNGFLTQDELYRLEYAANEAVYKNLRVEGMFPDEDELKALDYRSKKALTGMVRIVSIPGYDCCACCGLHVAATGEIGTIKITAAQNYKSGMRLSMLCGGIALADYYRKNRSVYEISAILSAKPGEVSKAVETLCAENARLGRRIWELRDRLFKQAAERISEGDLVCVFEEGLNAGELKRFNTVLCELGAGAVAVFSGGDGGYKYAIGGTRIDVSGFNRELTGLLSGRGGGAKGMAQGMVQATHEQIHEFFSSRNWVVLEL